MPAWATVVLVLGSSAIAVAAVLVAWQLQFRHARSERDHATRTELREKGAAVVAPVLLLLADAEPQRLTATPDTQTLTLMNELLERWKVLRDPIIVFGASHPSLRISEETDRLVLAVSNALMAAHWLIHDLPESWSTEALETAKADNADAVERTRGLLAAIRESPLL